MLTYHRSPNKSFSQLTPDTSASTISPGHKKKSSANLQAASFDNRNDLEIALEAKRRLIDQGMLTYSKMIS
jgi:hypothetical protein